MTKTCEVGYLKEFVNSRTLDIYERSGYLKKNVLSIFSYRFWGITYNSSAKTGFSSIDRNFIFYHKKIWTRLRIILMIDPADIIVMWNAVVKLRYLDYEYSIAVCIALRVRSLSPTAPLCMWTTLECLIAFNTLLTTCLHYVLNYRFNLETHIFLTIIFRLLC